MKSFIKITTFSLSIIFILSLSLFTYYLIVTNGVNLDESKLNKTIQNIEYYDNDNQIINTGILNDHILINFTFHGGVISYNNNSLWT